MTDSFDPNFTRRRFIGTVAGAAATVIAAPAIAQTSNRVADPNIARNISSFRAQSWQPYFSTTRGGAVLVDTSSRALHYWSSDQSIYRLYPTSVPISEELTRRGRTSVVRKVEGPGWAPTPSMKKRNPEWPDYVPPGPGNPLGTHALYLGWKYYRIHGTHDTRKIGRKSSNGCIGLYNEHIAELYSLVSPGAQVLLI
ncbi:lipoprotein-anchoring transpeptidase ErfK/SrfK [Aliiruegeria haliotis]|uniref:Lipoprotein-anchoring transpeptidase ErfK/SrfK n=1 Tax=Aliiruegeria haliotis TaxID=1280846 RepID=A0A2T0RPC8_9RHOB|nr:L,D-transpeptidase [Aliiruegeria haliotis]PRY23028.1 lipoprotein-anchoring transpeptidase ErfK/SrfK [Aliiruegeria haliotis]